MNFIFSLIVLCLVYLFESLVIKNKPSLIRYLIALALLVSYNYAYSAEVMWIYDEDLDEEVCVKCKPVKITEDLLNEFTSSLSYYNRQGDWAVKRAEEVSMKITIPDEREFTHVAIETLLVALATTDSKARLVGMCLVSVSNIIKKAIQSSQECQTYLSYAEHCYDMAEFYDMLLEGHAEGAAITNCHLYRLDKDEIDIECNTDFLIWRDETRPRK